MAGDMRGPTQSNGRKPRPSSNPSGLQMELPQITLEEWRQVVQRKPARTATGPDGVSRTCLLQLPRDLVIHVLEVYRHAEDTGCWPLQAMESIVAAIAKVQDAQRVSHSRLINVLSLTYRVYATIRSRQALKYLAEQSPDGLLGMLPRRSAQQVWFFLQLKVEASRVQGSTVCGISADLRKAFNLIPRLPTLACAIQLGLPVPLIRAWTGAFTMLSRRFRVGMNVGPPLFSRTGFAEGDAMSCVAMVVLNLAHHRYLSAECPQAQLLSYVDNWELIARDARVAGDAYRAMETFTRVT